MVWAVISLTGGGFFTIEEMQYRDVARTSQYSTSPQSGNNYCLRRAEFMLVTLPRVECGRGHGGWGCGISLGWPTKPRWLFEE